MVEMLDQAGARALVREYIESRLWWTLLPYDREDVLTDIERAHYWGQATTDFRIVMDPGISGMYVAFALKERMTPQDISEIVAGLDPADLVDRDILIFNTVGDHEGANLYLQSFVQWLGEPN